MKVSIEIVPKKEKFTKELNGLKQLDIKFDYLNFPHLARTGFYYPEELASLISNEKLNKPAILHLRVQDSPNIRQALLRINRILSDYKQNLELLLVTWDVKESKKKIIYTHNVLKLKNNRKISVCIDNYKPMYENLKKKLPYLRKYNKLFTQPIFNPERIDELEDFLNKNNFKIKPQNLFLGITWFTTEKSKNYWANINNVPLSDLPDKKFLENTLSKAIEIYRYAKQKGFSVYFMPIIQSLKHIEFIQDKGENLIS